MAWSLRHLGGVVRCVALASCLALGFSIASAATYTWDASNVSGLSGTSSLNWLNATQGSWTGGTPVTNDPATVIRFFANNATNLTNSGALTQTTVIDNGGTAFQLATLDLLGRGSATTNRNLTMVISGDPLNFAAATGAMNFNATVGGGSSQSIVGYTISAPVSLGTVGTTNGLTIDTNNQSTDAYRIDGIISELGVGSSLVKAGAGRLQLSAANTFTGGVTINAGTVAVGVVGGTSAGAVIGSGPLAINAGTFEVNGNVIGVVSQTVGSLAGSSSANLVINNRSLTFGSLNTDTTYAGSANGTLIKVGTGTTTLFSAGSTVSNVTVGIRGGTLKLGASKNVNIEANVLNTGTLDLDGYSVSGTLSSFGPGFKLLTGGGTFTNTNIQFFFSGASGGTVEIVGNLAVAATTNFRADSGGTKLLIIDGVLSGGATRIENSGNGFNATLRLTGSASNTFTGTWSMAAGVTELAKTGGAIAIPTNVTLTAGGLLWSAGEQIADTAQLSLTNGTGLNLNGFTETVRNLASPGTGAFEPNTTGKLILAGNVPNLIDIGTGLNVTKEVGLNIDLTGTGDILLTTTANQNRTMRIGNATAGQRVLDLGSTTRTVTVTGAGTLALPALISSQITGSGGLVKAGTQLLRLSANNTFTGDTRVDAGTLDLNGNGSGLAKSAFDTSGAGTLANISTTPTFGGLLGSNGFALGGTVTTLTLDVAAGATKTLVGALTGGAGTLQVTKTGAGTQVFEGVNSHNGTVRVLNGRLEVAGSGNLPAGGVTINGATADLRWNSSTALTRPLTFTQGTISGTGTIGVAVNAGTGQTLSPGNSPGIQPYSAGLTLSPGGSYVWEIDDATGGKGTEWDVIDVTGGVLNLSGLSESSRFILDLTTLTAGGASGPMENYVAGTEYTWRIFDALSLGLPASFGSTPYAAGTDITSLFTLLTTNWENTVPPSADISVQVASNGTGIDLVVVPEPATIALAGLGLGLASFALRRRWLAGIGRRG